MKISPEFAFNESDAEAIGWAMGLSQPASRWQAVEWAQGVLTDELRKTLIAFDAAMNEQEDADVPW